MKKTLSLLTLSVLLASCASLKPYSYSTYSKPTPQTVNLKPQSQVTVDTLVNPLDSVCHIKTTRRGIKTLWLTNAQFHGSAALIEDRFLLTAAHNVFDYPGSKLTSLKVTCGQTDVTPNNNVVAHLNRAQIEDSVSVPRYESRIFKNYKKFEFDYAFVDLGQSISQNSSFQLGSVDLDAVNSPVFIGGYPGGTISNGNMLHVGKSTSRDVDNNIMSYDISTATGNSGGPVWFKQADGHHKIVAIHVKNSAGRVVNDSLLSDWNAWRATR